MQGQDTVLASLDNQGVRFRLFGEVLHRPNDVFIVQKHPHLTVVDDDQVHGRHDLQQGRFGDVDPQIHRIEHRHASGVGLLDNASLNLGVKVGAKQNVGVFPAVGHNRLKVFKHVEVGGCLLYTSPSPRDPT